MKVTKFDLYFIDGDYYIFLKLKPFHVHHALILYLLSQVYLKAVLSWFFKTRKYKEHMKHITNIMQGALMIFLKSAQYLSTLNFI